MKFRVKHKTRYQYSAPVSMCFNEARMTPLNTLHQRCASHRFVVQPAPEAIHKRTDYFGNQVTHFDILQSHQEMSVTVISEVEVVNRSQQSLFSADYPWEGIRDMVKSSSNPEHISLREYVLASPLIPLLPELEQYALKSFTPKRSALESVRELMGRIWTDFKYMPNSTSISTPLHEVLANKQGVCQDFSHLAISCLRSIGLPAAYVSGYLETLPPPGQPKLEGADASHAWFAVHLLDSGWIHFDPTNNLMPADQHITVAIGRDFADVTPLKGVIYGGNEHDLNVSVDVARIEDL